MGEHLNQANISWSRKIILQKWLHDNDILMYSTYNERKFVVAEKVTKTLKFKIYKNDGN